MCYLVPQRHLLLRMVDDDIKVFFYCEVAAVMRETCILVGPLVGVYLWRVQFLKASTNAGGEVILQSP